MNTFFNPTTEFVDKLVELIGNRFVVEIGCGKGDLLNELITRGIPAIGVDPYVDKSDITDLSLFLKILDFDIPRLKTFLKGITNNNKEVVFLVARPCHSGFPQEYFRQFEDFCEMIYIGFAKNLELDFERDLSIVTVQNGFPKHSDCDIVAIIIYRHSDRTTYIFLGYFLRLFRIFRFA